MGSKKLRNKNKPKRSSSPSEPLKLLSYDISFEPIRDEAFQKLPEAVQAHTEELYNLTRNNPDQAIMELETLVLQYPDVPMLSNYLYAAYTHKGDSEKSQALVIDNYRQFPDYLFAKLAYGEIFLRAGNTEAFAKLLDNKFDLKLLYPERNVFHVAEFTTFSALVGWYFCLIGKPEPAQKLWQSMVQIAPDHPATVMLGHHVSMAALKVLMNLS